MANFSKLGVLKIHVQHVPTIHQNLKEMYSVVSVGSENKCM
jgi:hypothetical protein